MLSSFPRLQTALLPLQNDTGIDSTKILIDFPPASLDFAKCMLLVAFEIKSISSDLMVGSVSFHVSVAQDVCRFVELQLM